jgi:tripartite ATP-independent transporter DctM subunit
MADMDPRSLAEVLSLTMFAVACGILLLGFPVAFTLAGTAIGFAGLGWLLGVFDFAFRGALASRYFGVMVNELLVAVPLFVFMGVMLERSKIAEQLLETMGLLFGTMRGGLGLSVIFVGMLLAASTGIVGATVVTMGLLSLPSMLKAGYDPKLACGSICASGTLGQIIPPSIVLVLLGDILQGANTEAQLALGNFAPDPVSVIDLFAGAFLPGIMLVGLYMAWVMFKAFREPESCPPIALPEGDVEALGARVLRILVPPAALIMLVLGSILIGVATPTEAAAMGSIGAILLAGRAVDATRPWPVYVGAFCLVALVPLTKLFDLRMQREVVPPMDLIAAVVAGLCIAALVWGLVGSLIRVHRSGILAEVMQMTVKISSIVFVILLGGLGLLFGLPRFSWRQVRGGNSDRPSGRRLRRHAGGYGVDVRDGLLPRLHRDHLRRRSDRRYHALEDGARPGVARSDDRGEPADIVPDAAFRLRALLPARGRPALDHDHGHLPGDHSLRRDPAGRVGAHRHLSGFGYVAAERPVLIAEMKSGLQ